MISFSSILRWQCFSSVLQWHMIVTFCFFSKARISLKVYFCP